jgi:hypothetical protein
MTWDNTYGCYYNKCNYEVSVSNSGSAAGTVWKRVLSGDGSAEEVYNQVVNPSATVDLGSEWTLSECDISHSYNVNVYDSNENSIGSTSFTCLHP